MTDSFCQQLQSQVDISKSLLCIGLDPHVDELPEPTAEAAIKFCRRIIDATLPYAAAFKPNVAFFERFGAAGHDALVEVLAMIPKSVPVILDAKRGDIGSTSEAYAAACLGKSSRSGGGGLVGLDAHSVTVNPYMGSDSLEPFLRDPSKGAFLLCKTSNPGSNELQTLRCTAASPSDPSSASEMMVYERVAQLAHGKWGLKDNVGLVVGATDVEAIEAVRRQAPETWLLSPGVGAQGGNLALACKAGLFQPSNSRSNSSSNSPASLPTGILFPVSRGVSQAADPGLAAKALVDAINECRVAKAAELQGKRKEEEEEEGGGGDVEGVGSPVKRVKAGSEEEGGQGAGVAAYQAAFIDFAVSKNVLRFGEFTLKSGRKSPYFFNAGLFASGGSIASLAKYYAEAIDAHKHTLTHFDVIFGPAYKGIPLATAVGMALSFPPFGRDVGVAYNRKEAKDHGEGGTLVGASMKGKRVLIVDDVITAGTAIREAVSMVRAAGGTLAGVVIALDRQEVGPGAAAAAAAGDGGGAVDTSRESAVMSVQREFGCPVVSVVGLNHLSAYLNEKAASSSSSLSSSGSGGGGGDGGFPGGGVALAEAIAKYRRDYGVC